MSALHLQGLDSQAKILNQFKRKLGKESFKKIEKLLDSLVLVTKKTAEETAFTIWSVEDVLCSSCDSNNKETVTKEEATIILQNIEDNFDASVGINWDTIIYEIEEYRRENPNINSIKFIKEE